MPFPAYHIGPNALLGMLFRKWLDPVVVVLANIAVDIEVPIITRLMDTPPVHRYLHTLLLAAVSGAVFGLAMFPFGKVFERFMSAIQVLYKPILWKMIVSGILGAWLHVLTDAVYHYDVRAFWPWKDFPTRPLWNLVSQTQLKYICLLCMFLTLIVYGSAVYYFRKDKHGSVDSK